MFFNFNHFHWIFHPQIENGRVEVIENEYTLHMDFIYEYVTGIIKTYYHKQIIEITHTHTYEHANIYNAIHYPLENLKWRRTCYFWRNFVSNFISFQSMYMNSICASHIQPSNQH